jgi:hypothetical protein
MSLLLHADFPHAVAFFLFTAAVLMAGVVLLLFFTMDSKHEHFTGED